MPTKFAITNAVTGWPGSHGSSVRYRPWTRKLKMRKATKVAMPPTAAKRPISLSRRCQPSPTVQRLSGAEVDRLLDRRPPCRGTRSGGLLEHQVQRDRQRVRALRRPDERPRVTDRSGQRLGTPEPLVGGQRVGAVHGEVRLDRLPVIGCPADVDTGQRDVDGDEQPGAVLLRPSLAREVRRALRGVDHA